MRKFIIKQKMGGTGSIHDLSHDQFDRVIKIRQNYNYVIVFAAYHSMGSLYFCDEARLIQKYKQLNAVGFSFKVFNADGQALVFDGVQFIADRDYPALTEI